MPTILAIDDRNDNLIALTALLRNLLPGTTVLTALSGPEGIEKARVEQPDAIVLDIIMPGMDGYETCRLLQADERTRHIPVIMVTAIRTDSDSRVKGLEFGANAFLSKPIDGHELVSQVKVAFRIKDAEDALRRERDSLERTVAERTAALRESQAVIEAAGRIARFGGWSVDLTATPQRVAWSDEVALIYEMPPGHSPTVEESIAFYAPEWRERIARVFGDCVRDGTPYDEEMEIITARDRRVWVRTLGVAQRDASGAIVKVAGAFQDITERKQAEQAEVHVRTFSDAAIQSLPGIFYLINAEGHFLRWNDNFETVSGYTGEEIARLHPTDFFTGDEKELIRQRIGKVFTEGEADAEAHFTSKDGTRTPYYFTGRRVLLDGQPHLVGTGLDLTARRRAEKALQDLAHAVNTAGDVVFLTDRDGIIMQVNEQFTALYGHTAEEVVGKVTPRILKSGKHPPEFYAAIWAALVRGEVVHYDVVNRTKDGRQMEIEEAITSFRDDQGELAGFMAVQREITARRQAEKALQDLAHAVNASGDAVFTTDPDGIITSVNAQFTKLYGYTAEEVVGQVTPRILKSGKHPPEFYAAIWELGHRESITRENVNRAKDGRLLAIEQTISPFQDEQGKLAGFLSVQREIGARKRAEAEAELLQTIALGVGAASDLDDALAFVLQQVCATTGWAMGEAWLPNREGTHLECHPVWHSAAPGLEQFRQGSQNIHLAPGEGLVGRVWQTKRPELMPDLAVPAHLRRFKTADETGLTAGLGVPVLSQDDEVLLVLGFFLFAPSEEDPRRVELIAAVSAQIGSLIGRKQAEAALRASETKHRLLFDTSRDSLMTLAPPDWRFASGNPATVAMFAARDEAEFVAKGLGELSPAHQIDGRSSSEKSRAMIETAMREGSHLYEWTHRRLTGEDFPATVLLTRFELNGQPLLQATVRDITEQKQLATQLLRSQRMEGIGSLAGGVAHDLNNILAPILIIGPLLRETVTDPDSVQMLNTVEDCAQRAADIIKQLLEFARGKPEARAPLPVRHLLNKLAGFMGETFPRNLEVRVESPDALWPILGDATQIHQTLMNLLVNARDAMPDGGTLLLAARNETLDPAAAARTPDANPGPYVCVSVADTGTGIAPEHLERIFDPFFTTKEIGKGTGLGLATVAGIVRGHGGFVRVNSRVGEGTRIEVCFPAAPEASAPAPAQAQVRSAALPPPAQGELVLLVDDEPNVCRLVQRVLEKHGYRVLPAANGGEALTLLTRHRAEVRAVVTDLMMPGMQGPALIQALRRLDPRLPIIAMTGLIEPAKTRELESLGLAAMLPKPFDPDDLLRALHRAVLPADGPPPTASV